MLMPKSSKKVWWMCSRGHEWEGRISDRTGHNSGCPFCHKPYSLLEIRAYTEIISVFPNTTWTADVDGVEVDILINDMNIGVEIDGYYWHKNKYAQDRNKTVFLKKKGIKLLRLREKPLKLLDKTDIGYKYTYLQNSYLDLIKKLIAKIGIMANKNVSDYLSRSDFANSSLYQKIVSEVSMPSMSVANVSPELVVEWHPLKNGGLKPAHVSFGCQQKAWWKCGKGHEWEAVVATRVKGHGCPYCSGRNVTPTTSLLFINPELAKQWHPTKNGNLCSSDVSSGSSKKVWWICREGHEWQAKVASRDRGCNCPVCHEKNRGAIAKKAHRQK